LPRVVGHIDFDYFYAQVEEVENPSLKGRPVIVCVFSGRTEESGVVSTANYKAREFGIHSGMPINMAKKRLAGKNPQIIKMEHEKYEVISKEIMNDLESMVDALEPTGIDEAFFDITTSTGGDYVRARESAQLIKESIFRHKHLTCSMGLGQSKIVAKLSSDLAKPGGLMAVIPETTEAFMAPLPVAKLYGVGPKTSSVLGEMGVRTIGELAKTNPSRLQKEFGSKLAGYLLAASTGTDTDPVVVGLEPTQFSRMVTLKRDTRDPHQVYLQLSEGIEHIHKKLTSSDKTFRTVTAIAILTDLSARTKSKTFETSVNDLALLREAVPVLFEELSKTTVKDYRRVGVRVSGLANSADQTSLSEFVRPAG